MVEAGRSAEALLRVNGGRSVLLRLPRPPVAGNDAEVLGLATPEFDDVELTPVVFRKSGSTAVLLVSASAVKGATGTLAFDSAQVLFANAVAVVIDGVMYGIRGLVAEQAFGTPYCYVVSLQAPVA